jgi:hypothetical protein
VRRYDRAFQGREGADCGASAAHKTKPSQKRREPTCEGDTWGTHFASLSNPIVDHLLDMEERIYEPVLDAIAVSHALERGTT